MHCLRGGLRTGAALGIKGEAAATFPLSTPMSTTLARYAGCLDGHEHAYHVVYVGHATCAVQKRGSRTLNGVLGDSQDLRDSSADGG